MNKVKIAVTFSEEVSSDAATLKNYLDSKQNFWARDGVTLETILMHQTFDQLSQDFDILILLMGKTIGKNSEQEFETIFGCHQENTKPIVLPYAKDLTFKISQLDPEQMSCLWSFQNKLKSLGYSITVYENSSELILTFLDQLERLVRCGFDTFLQPARNVVPPHLTSLPHDLTPPPFSAPLFLGREKEMKKIQDLLAEKNSIILSVSGVAGIGKSSLLSEYYRVSGNSYQHCAWINFGIGDNQPMIETCANLAGPNLLVIDNIGCAKDLKEITGALSKLDNFHILLSSQSVLSQSVENITLESVSKEVALQIFKKYYLKHQPFDDYLFFEMWTSISGNTQLLEFLAKNLNNTNIDRERYPLKKLCSDIQFKNPMEILATFYSGGKFKKLTQAEKKLLSIFSVLPAEQIDFNRLERLGEFVEYFEASLFSLSQKGWIGYNPVQNSYRCSPLIQEIVSSKATNLYEDCGGLIDYLVEMLDTNPTFNTTWVRYGENLVKRLPMKNYNDGILCDRLGDYFESIGDYTKALTYYTIDLTLTKNLINEYPLNEEFRNGVAISYEKIGQLHRDRLNDEKKAQNYFTLALQIWTNLVVEDPGNEEYASSLTSIRNELEKL